MADIPVRIKGEFQGGNAFDKADKKTKKLKKSTKAFTASLRDLVVISTGVKRALGSMVGALGKINKAADRQIRAEASLSIQAGKLGRDVKKTVGVFRDFSREIQATTTFGDEFVLELSSMAMGLGKMTNNETKDAVRAALDFSEAYGVDAKMAVTQLARILTTGQSGLSRYGVSIDEGSSKAEKFAQAVEQMSSGTAKAFGQLPTSKMKQAQNAFGDMVEAIGLMVTQSGTYKQILNVLTGGFGDLADALRDPETVKKWINAFDKFVSGTLRVAGEVIGGLLIGFGKLVELVENIQRFGFLANFEKEARKASASIVVFEDRIVAIKRVMRDVADEINGGAQNSELLRAHFKALGGELDTLGSKLADARWKAQSTGNEIGQMGRDVRDAIQDFAGDIDDTPFQSLQDFVVKIGEDTKAFWDNLRKGGKSAAVALSASMTLIRDTIRTNLFGEDSETFQLVSEEQRQLIYDEASALGSGWASIFAGSLTEGIINAEGPREAFKMLGDDVKNSFIGQMSQEAFAPLRESFGLLAQTLALPFKIVGTVINDLVLAPLVKAVSKVISGVIGGLLEIFGLQIAAQSATAAAFASTIAMSIPLAIQLSGMAAAAAIASFGSALAFGPAAIGVIKSSAAAGGVPFAEEGGLFMPNSSTGGQLIHVAEHEPEVVIPVSKLGGGGLDGGLGGGMQIEVNVDSVGSGAGDIQSFVDAVADALQFRLAEAGFGGRI